MRIITHPRGVLPTLKAPLPSNMADIDDGIHDTVVQPRSEPSALKTLQSMLRKGSLSGKEKPMKVWCMRTEF